uniref:Secreted protein n=1 Tax=Globodera pallida TaxID=36090 RepID=A0A183CMH1_GLOPA
MMPLFPSNATRPIGKTPKGLIKRSFPILASLALARPLHGVWRAKNGAAPKTMQATIASLVNICSDAVSCTLDASGYGPLARGAQCED